MDILVTSLNYGFEETLKAMTVGLLVTEDHCASDWCAAEVLSCVALRRVVRVIKPSVTPSIASFSSIW